MENFVIGVASSIVGAIIIALFGKWIGWWWPRKNAASIDLATRTLKALEGELDQKTTAMVYATKQLGDSLANHYRKGIDYNVQREQEAQDLIKDMLLVVQPLVSELSAASPELGHLKRAVIRFMKGLEWRAQTIKHLCHPPNAPAMDRGHVRDQLLSVNVVPHELLNAAKGEAALYLRGYGLGWRARRKHRNEITRRHRAPFREAVESEYRKVLQQTSLHKAKK